MPNIFLQIFILCCFIGLVIVLFFEKKDYILFSIFFIFIGGIATAIFIPEARTLEFYIMHIEWELIIFLLTMFTIVEILKENKVFHEVAKRIVIKYKDSPRKMFYVICIVSTLLASVVEDLSVALIFGPIIIIVCRKLNINPAPFLLGMTITINLAATLTPFGSAQNILIANEFGLNIVWFISTMGIYFVIATVITLFLLDKTILRQSLRKKWEGQEYDDVSLEEKLSGQSSGFSKNIAALIVFVVLLVILPEIYLAGLIGMFIFVLLNTVKKENEKNTTSLMHYLQKVDYKLIYFFVCLFVFVSLMDVNGTLLFLETLIAEVSYDNIFILSIIILLSTSILSGFLDNTPVVIIFIPIIRFLTNLPGIYAIPVLIAFIIGINVGGNFLPQGSACDMATLEIARANNVRDLPFKRLFKFGSIFAIAHVVLGIFYLGLIVYIFPM